MPVMPGIAEQYTRVEYCQLVLANRLRRWLLQRLFYLESDLVFGDLIQRGASARREGPFNWITYPDGKLGEWCVRLRRHTSDFRVLRQVVLLRQYEPVVQLLKRCDRTGSAITIVDAGANIGLASIYFARSFPGAKVIAIEPDAGNFEACCVNLEQSGTDNVTPLLQALWKEDVPLEVKCDFRDGREWSRRVEASASMEGSVRGVSLPTLLEQQQLGSIDLFKLDVEGAEAALFERPSAVQLWLPKVTCLAVEIHEPTTYDLIVPQLRASGFIVLDRGELTLAVQRERIRPDRLLDYFESEPAPRELPVVV